MNYYEQRTDEELAGLLANDAQAFDAILRRHINGLYDCALRISLDPEVAAIAAEDALFKARDEISRRPAGLAFRAWLYGLARNAALDNMRKQGRADDASDGGRAPLAVNDRRFLQAMSANLDSEVLGWVWQAARGQRPRDYSLLDLALRRDLTPPEVGSAASLARSNVYTVLGRLRGAFEESFAATYLFYRARRHCPELESICGDSLDLGPAVRREVARHSEGCLTCREVLAALPLAADIFADLRPIDAPAGLIRALTQTPESDAASPFLTLVPPPDHDTTPRFAALPPVVSEISIDTPTAESDAAELPPLQAEDPTPVVWQEEVVQPDHTPWHEEDLPPEDADDRGPVAMGFPQRPRQTTSVTNEAEAASMPPASSPTSPAQPQSGVLAAGRSFDGNPPPRRPRTGFLEWYREQSPQKFWLLVLAAGLILLAVYAGIAVGDSIQGTGGASSFLPPLPTRPPSVREVACGDSAINLEQGSSATLTFDQGALPGYRIEGVEVEAVSASARASNVAALQQEGLSILFETRLIPGSGSRTDEYRLKVTFVNGDDETNSSCEVLVSPPAPTATPLPSPTATEVAKATTAPPPTVPAATSTQPSTLPPATVAPTAAAPPTPSPPPTSTALATSTPAATFTPVP